MEPVTLVFQTLNEAETIGAAIREIPVAYRLNIIGLTRLTAPAKVVGTAHIFIWSASTTHLWSVGG